MNRRVKGGMGVFWLIYERDCYLSPCVLFYQLFLSVGRCQSHSLNLLVNESGPFPDQTLREAPI